MRQHPIRAVIAIAACVCILSNMCFAEDYQGNSYEKATLYTGSLEENRYSGNSDTQLNIEHQGAGGSRSELSPEELAARQAEQDYLAMIQDIETDYPDRPPMFFDCDVSSGLCVTGTNEQIGLASAIEMANLLDDVEAIEGEGGILGLDNGYALTDEGVPVAIEDVGGMQLEMQMQDWLCDPTIAPMALSGLRFFGNSWQTTLSGFVPQRIGDLELLFPVSGEALYSMLIPYLQGLAAAGCANVNISKLDIYDIDTYGCRTIKTSTPTSTYHWMISGNGINVDTYTNTNYLQALFRSAGTYSVQVGNIQNVIRNNRVSGTKTELWVLNTRDNYRGIVIYNHTVSFEAYIGEDIGPEEEEVPLLDQGFTATISDQAVNTVQFVDVNGNIHSPTSGYTTERIA